MSKGLALWDAVWAAGEKFNIRAGCPNLIERLETGLLSYGSEMTLENNPFECGLDRFCDFDKPAEYMAREALADIAKQGVHKRMVNLRIEGEPMMAPRSTWPVLDNQRRPVGIVTSLAYSEKFTANLCFATVNADCSDIGTQLTVDMAGVDCSGQIANRNWLP